MQHADTTQESIDTDESTSNDIRPQDLSLFQQEILLILASEGASYGLKIKRELEDTLDTEVNHGRLYPNLDTLVELGFVKKSERDKRTNDYRLTADGRYLVRKDAQRRYLIAQDLKPGNGGDE